MASTRNMTLSGQISQMHVQQDILQQLNALLQGDSRRTTDAAGDGLLGQLYTLTKSPDGPALASSICASDVALLGCYGFDANSSETRHSALRCLNNILAQAPSATRLFVNAGLLGRAIDLLLKSQQSLDTDDEFLAARLLVLCSAYAAPDLLPCLQHGGLAEAINANLARHAPMPSLEPTSAYMANIQLLLVLAAKHEAQKYRFFDSVVPILEIFGKMPIPSPPLETPISLLIDALAVLPFHSNTGEGWPFFHEEKLVQILHLCMQAYREGDLETRSTPLVTLLFCIAREAPEETKERLGAYLLPSDEDRTQVLGQGSSLPHRLVRVSTEAVTPAFKTALAYLLLELSGGDPRRLIHNVGFGCGIGLLRALGIAAPPGGLNDGEIAGGLSEINPITGQRRDLEYQPTLPEMTDEEKEREAERLFVLFERLKATGVVDIENPVAAIARSGQVEELDSEVEDED